MVNFFDRFWVPQHDGVPDKNYLIVLLMIHVVLLVAIFIIHKIIRYRISNSMKGPAEDANIIIPHILSEALSLIFWGSFMVLLSNMITHCSGILGPFIGREGAYFLIGQEDLFWGIGLELLFVGIFNFYHELTREGEHDVINFNPYYIVFIPLSLFIITFIFGQIFIVNVENIVTLLVVTIFVLINLYFVVKMIVTWKKGNSSRLIIYRKFILLVSFGFSVSLTAILGSNFIPYFDPNLGELYYPTRHIEVELLIMGTDLLIFFDHLALLFIVFPPMSLLTRIGITERDYLENADYRFDELFSFTRKIHEIDEMMEPKDKSQVDYIISYYKYEKRLAKQLKETYGGKVIDFSLLDEETLRKLVLPTSEIIFLDQSQSRHTKSIFGILRREYAIDLVFDGKKVVFGSYIEYKSSNYRYVLITMIPSYWNFRRKFWHVNYDYKLRTQVIDFLEQYKSYLEEISTQNSIVLMLLRFPVYNDIVGGIPSIRMDSNIPDPRYIHFFKSE